MKLKPLIPVLLLTSAVVMANPYESKKEEIASVVETGQKASMALLKELGGNLKKQMKAHGPLKAAEFCSTNAYPLTDNVADAMGKEVSIKRISLKERNPANAPDAKERAVLASLQSLQNNDVILPEYLVEQVNKDTYKFYKPLSINKGVCLKCHGNLSKNPQLAAFMAKSYPGDKSTGYKMGDLRGAIVVTVKK